MASRAIHLETATSLTTDSFLNAYRRFVCRRGPIQQLRSDQGTNFVGAKNELQAALNEVNHEKIQRELLFCEFLKKESRIACNPITLVKMKKYGERKEEPRRGRFTGNNKNKSSGTGSFATEAEVKDSFRERKEDKKPKADHCLLCKKAHNLDECDKFAKMSQTEKKEFVRPRGICLGCLKYGHLKKDCHGRKICKKCKGFHPTSLHIDSPASQEQTSNEGIPEATSHPVEASNSEKHAECYLYSLIVPVWLRHEQASQDKQLIDALLDDQSDACFIKDTVLEKCKQIAMKFSLSYQPSWQKKLSCAKG